MNKERKTNWTTALRSGNYKQTVGMLRDSKGFCCLGVACDLVAKEGGGKWIGQVDNFHFRDNFEEHRTHSLTKGIKDLYGIEGHCEIDIDCNYKDRQGYPLVLRLTDLNDYYRLTFDQIADVIDYFL
jgi:hypothetical protein